MKFSPKCRTKKSGMIYTILGSFCSFLNCERAVILPQIKPRNIPVIATNFGFLGLEADALAIMPRINTYKEWKKSISPI